MLWYLGKSETLSGDTEIEVFFLKFWEARGFPPFTIYEKEMR